MIEPWSTRRSSVGTFMLTAALLASGAGELDAQSLPLAGDRIRVASTLYSGTAEFIGVAADTLVLLTGSAEERRLAFSSIHSLELSRGRLAAGEAIRTGVLTGALSWGAAGGLLGLILCGDPDPCNSSDRAQVVLIGAGVVGALGAVTMGITYLAYSQIAGERWSRVQLPARVRLDAMPGGRAGFAVCAVLCTRVEYRPTATTATPPSDGVAASYEVRPNGFEPTGDSLATRCLAAGLVARRRAPVTIQ
jgi:hypothetical protein